MLLPTPKLLVLLALPVPALLLLPGQATTVLAVGYDVAMVLAGGAERALSARPGQIIIQRRLPQHLSLGTQSGRLGHAEPGSLRRSSSS